jgi:ATP-dependent Clp endopeptidase proteolytic subunit ClpP
MSNNINEVITVFHNDDICYQTRTITLFGEVSDTMMEKALKNLHFLNRSIGTITIYINSCGGDLDAGKAIYDAIKYSKNVIRIVCFGEVASCGALILMAGDERIMTPSSRLMLHAGEESVPSAHPRNVDALVKNHRDDEKFIEGVYLERIHEKNRRDKKKLMSKKDIKELLVFDRYISPEESLKMGLITGIGYRMGDGV